MPLMGEVVFRVGDYVTKQGGDYRFVGVVVTRWRTVTACCSGKQLALLERLKLARPIDQRQRLSTALKMSPWCPLAAFRGTLLHHKGIDIVSCYSKCRPIFPRR
jgi:hypothetical protein